MSSDTNHVLSSKFNLSAWALANQQLVAFLMLVIVIAGILSYQQLPRNEDPEFTIKTVVISTSWPGATVLDTMNFVTEPLEKKLQETPYIDYVESFSRAGESVISLNLRDDTPPAAVPGIWYTVRKRMSDVAALLPQGASPPTVNDEFDDTFGTIFGFSGDGYSAREMHDHIDNVRSALLSVPDVGKIEMLGVEDEQIVIEFSSHRLAGMGLNLQQVIESIQAQNAVTPAGVIRTDKERITLLVSGAFTSEQSLNAITLRISDRFVKLEEIASIRREPTTPPTPDFRVNGQKALGLAISMAPTGNMQVFGEAIKARMAALEASLPQGITVYTVADQSVVVEEAISGFVKVLLEAVIIVLAVSFVTLGTRAGLVVAVSVPIVLAMSFIGMEMAGIGLQRISLGALIIALGLLVDDAMITVEAMVSRLEAGWDKQKAATWAYQNTAFPMLTGTLVMIAGFIPVGFASSGAGEYCYSMFMVVVIALISSWVVAVLFSPLLGVWLLSAKMAKHNTAPGRVSRGYERLLQYVLQHRGLTLITALLLLTLSIFGTTQLDSEFFPSSDRPELLVSLNLPQNAAQSETLKRTLQLEQLLLADPDVAHFSSYVGMGAVRFYLPMDILLSQENVAQLVIVAKGLDERDALKKRLDAIMQTEFSDLVTRVSPLELGPPVGWPLKYRVTGPDLNIVRELATELSTIVASVPGTQDVNMTAGEPERFIQIGVNQTEARAVGLTSQDVASALATIFSGNTLTSVRDGKHLVDVVIKGTDAERNDIATVANLQIQIPDGRSVPLRQIATIAFGISDPIVWRRQRLPFISVQTDVTQNIGTQSVSDTVAPHIERFRQSLPDGYQVEEGGVLAESEKGNTSIYSMLPVSLLVILVLLMVQLRCFSRTALALLTAPFGLIGVVLAMLPTGTPMGFVALLGVIALAGMIIRNAVILISEVDSNEDAGMPRDTAILEATRHRARPILLTAMAAILGMLPIAHQVFWGPMAYAIIGGLMVATLFTLTVLPAGMSLLMQLESKRSNKFSIPPLGYS